MMLKKRNVAFFVATLVNLIFFLVAVLCIGFKQYRGPRFWLGDLANPAERLTSNPIFEYTQTDFDFINSSFGLILAGLILSGLIFILALIVFSWTLMQWFDQIPLKTYRWIEGTLVAGTIVAVIFIFTGELLFTLNYYYVYRAAQWKSGTGSNALLAYGPTNVAINRFKDMWQITSFVWLLILTLLPLIAIVSPYTFSWKFLKTRRFFRRYYKNKGEN